MTDVSSDAMGYGRLGKILHWTMFAAMTLQFILGYSIDRFDDLLEGVVDRWFRGEEETLLVPHVVLGVIILILATVRVVWRRTTTLPPWAEGLSERERRLVPWVERVLYFTMFLIPITGLALVLLSGESWDLMGGEWEAPREWLDDDLILVAHIVGHLVFFGALLVHVGLVLKHQFVDRDRLLNRML